MWITREKARALARRLLHTNDTPERTSLAFAVGVGLGLSPFIGLHTLLALLLAFRFRLNRVAVLAGAWLNNPYTIFPLYWFGTMLGSVMTGHGWVELPWPERGDFESWKTLWNYVLELRPVGLYFLVGNLTLSLLGGVLSYFLALPVIRRLRAHHEAHVRAQEQAAQEQAAREQAERDRPAGTRSAVSGL